MHKIPQRNSKASTLGPWSACVHISSYDYTPAGLQQYILIAQTSEPISPHASTSATSDGIDTTAGANDKSTTTKLKEAIKKPFVKEKETPPELQAAIEVMEARKEETARKMDAQGKDSSVLSGKRIDLIK
jgi:hypothetical protein